MKSKKYLKLVISLLCFILIFAAAVNIIIDPLFQYHKPFFGMQPVITNERYQNEGIAKNFDYDNAIIGNSMSENYRVSEFEQAFGGKTVKLVMAGTHALEWSYMLKLISKRENMPKNILMHLDASVFYASTTVPDNIPSYLFDDNIINDVSYWFNFKLLKMSYDMVRRNINNTVPDYNEAFTWDRETNKDYVLKHYDRPEKSTTPVDVDSKVNHALENINLLKKYIDSMKDTRFTFVFSPFSILSYDRMILQNELDAFEMSCISVVKALLQCENVNVLFWTDDNIKEIICNLNNYTDTQHYSKEISHDLTKRIENKTGLLTKENYKSVISDFFDFVRSYDYESIFK